MNEGTRNTSWLPQVATAPAVLSCYGTTALIGVLSLLGVTLAIDEGVWAGVIGILAGLATIAIAVSYRRHRIVGPTVVAALGLGLILWVMFGSYSRLTELAGFVLLVAATLWDWRARKSRSGVASGLSWIEAHILADRLKRAPAPIVIDVREPDELLGPLGRIAVALNIPVGELPNRLMEINAFKDKPIILVCQTDKRSANAAAILRGSGFPEAHVLRGGMERWNEEGLPVEHRVGFGHT
jgi:rhodanese-related sulfurtransferase